MNKFLLHLESLGLKIHHPISTTNSLCFECDVFAKPGSKKESLVVSAEGSLVVKTHSRPIDGEANNAIIEMVAKNFGIAKSKIILIRGDKSKNKRIKLLVEITANKDENFYIEKTTSILKD